MKLKKSKVVFDEANHTYHLNGVQLSGITSIIKEKLFPGQYGGVPKAILQRAADYGHKVHTMCELVDELDTTLDDIEAQAYIRLRDERNLVHEASEYIVTDKVSVASPIDKVYRVGENEFILGDVKTTYKLNIPYLEWQLSIYAYLFERQNKGAKVVGLLGIWIRKDERAEMVDINRIPDEHIEALLNSYREGTDFVDTYHVVESDSIPVHYLDMEEGIIDIIMKAKHYADAKKTLSDGVMKEMVRAGVYKWCGEDVEFVRREDSIRKTFDTERFKADHPDLYEQYIKESTVVGSVTIKVSKQKQLDYEVQLGLTGW